MNLPKLTDLKKIGRSTACILLLVVIFLVYEIQLADWQLVHGEDFQEIALSNQTDTLEISAARGEILDKNGVVLAGNKISYDVIYNAADMVYKERNATIIKLVSLFQERKEEWRDVLPILLDEEGNYQFKEDADSAIATLKETFSLAEYATADDCMNALISWYSCSGYSKEETRAVASVRYSMTRDGFSLTNPYVLATDVSVETVGVLSQREKEFPGIETQVSVSRYYGEDGALAPHAVGHVGDIPKAQYDEAVENGTAYDSETNPSGYKWTDTVGVDGLEAAFETELRGQRGHRSVISNDSPDGSATTTVEPPVEGNSVHLTLDAELQRVANLSLEENVKANTAASNCTAGAVVVLDPKTFGVLASASYPTYDMNRFIKEDKYIQLLNEDKDAPVYDRALTGAYTPGSTFKPMVALAGLQEQVIGASSTLYNCNGMFEYFDLKLHCTGTHGYANVYEALKGSCNAFFCQLGLDLTIKKMDAYAECFALGTETGVELPEEKGIMSNPQEYAELHLGAAWTDGLSAQTAIGQCDNAFTPMQLATYCATIANQGVRLKTHYLDKITNYEGTEEVRSFQPEQMSDAGLSSDVLGVVQEGMRQVAGEPGGTAYSVFGDYPVSVAAKTGTAETSDQGDGEGSQPNLTFIAYAPMEDPQIAVAVVMEKGWKGAYAQNVAKDIMDQYFGYVTRDEEGYRYNSNGDRIDETGRVILTKEEVEAERQAKEEAERNANATPAPQGEGSQASDETPSPDATPSPTAGGSRDEGIPTTPFTGQSDPSPSASSPSASSPGEEQEPQPSEKPKVNSPFWSGG